MPSRSCCEVTRSIGQVWPPVHHPPNSRVSMVRADNMTVGQTAEWVRTHGRYNLWDDLALTLFQLDLPVWSFHKEGWPAGVPSLICCVRSSSNLRCNMSIPGCCWRMVISTELRMQYLQLTQFHPHILSWDYVCSMFSSAKCFEGSFFWNRQLIANIISNRYLHLTMPNCSLTVLFVNFWGRYPIILFTANFLTYSSAPSHPVVYKTLQKPNYERQKVVLRKFSVICPGVLSFWCGIVVFRDQFGGNRTAGWVTLYSEDNEQLLRKYNPPTKDCGFALSSIADVMVEQDFGTHLSKA